MVVNNVFDDNTVIIDFVVVVGSFDEVFVVVLMVDEVVTTGIKIIFSRLFSVRFYRLKVLN